VIIVYEVKLSGSYYDLGLRTGKMLEKDKGLNISDYLVNRKIDLVITTPVEGDYTERECNYCISRKAIDFNIPTILNMELAEALTEAIEQRRKGPFQMKSWNECFA